DGRGGGLTIRRCQPAGPCAGESVRVYGGLFNAVGGNPAPNHCNDPQCTTNDDCASGSCVEGSCGSCAVDNKTVRKSNMQNNANRVVLLSEDGTEKLETIYPDAVTPTMLVFTMPWD